MRYDEATTAGTNHEPLIIREAEAYERLIQAQRAYLDATPEDKPAAEEALDACWEELHACWKEFERLSSSY